MDYTKAFLSGVKDCEYFKEGIDIVKKNSSGKIWLIGGFCYRTIAEQLYGTPKQDVDLDFIVENNISEFNLPNDWKVKTNRFGNPKFTNGKKEIDYIPLKNIYSILKRKIEPTIENFLTGTPFNIHSIAYDTYDKRVIGETGIDSLKRKIIEVNNFPFADYFAQIENKSINSMIKEKAEGLGFTPNYPR